MFVECFVFFCSIRLNQHNPNKQKRNHLVHVHNMSKQAANQATYYNISIYFIIEKVVHLFRINMK